MLMLAVLYVTDRAYVYSTAPYYIIVTINQLFGVEIWHESQTSADSVIESKGIDIWFIMMNLTIGECSRETVFVNYL